MTQMEYDRMCKEARTESEKIDMSDDMIHYYFKISKKYAPLFNHWKNSDVDPVSKVMQDVFGGGE